MSRKKIGVVELNKKEEKIILEEKETAWTLFWKKYGTMVFITSLILSVTILIVSIFVAVSNLLTSEQPTIKEVSVDTNLTDASVTVDPSMPLTEENAEKMFASNNVFKNNGEVLLVKEKETGTFILKFYSDYTVLKIMKNDNIITRINSIDERTYGIDENGVINSKAVTIDIKKIDTKEYEWGIVNYFSDGSADIINSKIDMFVRNAKDINENYISNNKVTYLKNSENVGNIKLNYYYDGTIEVIKNNTSYIVRNHNDLKTNKNDVTFKNNNEATIKDTITLSDGKKIDYYTDGGAIITDGSRTLSVRKSNSIIIKDNKIFEIVDNKYVTISNIKDNGNVIYYTNGSAVVNNYNRDTLYIEENSNIKYKKDEGISNITNKKEKLTEKRNIDDDKILKFETVAVVETEEFIAIVPKDSILYDKDGSIKDLLDTEIDTNDKPIVITNNTNEPLTYRLVIEKSDRTNLDVEYIRYQLSVGETNTGAKRLDSNVWKKDEIADVLTVQGTNYILLDKTLDPHATDEIRLMLWTDYETIPNSMQDKYFYGTIKIYAWKEVK